MREHLNNALGEANAVQETIPGNSCHGDEQCPLALL